MADTKITALTAITTVDPAVDVFPIVDVSDTTMAASGTTKKITSNQLLGAGGTATLASASITGDLTVDTNTLKVDSANNRVGIQITSPTAPLEVGETSGTALRLRRLTSGNTIDVNFYNTNTTVGDVAGIRCDGDGLANTFGAISFWTTQTPNSLVERYRISSVGVHTWQNVGGVAGTAMTLNSTGLGVGVTPAAGDGSGAFKAYGTGSLTANSRVGLDVRELVSGNQAGIILGAMTTENTAVIGSRTGSGNIAFQTYYAGSWGERMRIANDGNVGIGVTPSGTIYSSDETRLVVKGTSNNFAGTLAVQSKGTINAVTGFLTAGDTTNEVAVGSATNSPLNFYINGALKATIDVSGNLILQSSATPATLGTNGQLTVNATSNTNLRFSYRGSDGVTRVANITLA